MGPAYSASPVYLLLINCQSIKYTGLPHLPDVVIMEVPVIVSAIFHAANIVDFFKLVTIYYQILFPMVASVDGELVVLRVKSPLGIRR